MQIKIKIMKSTYKFCIIISCLIFFISVCHAQIKNGLYFGGDLYEGSKTFGYYWFYDDSCFILFNQNKTDTISNNIGIGIWKIDKKGELQLTFNESRLNINSFYPGNIIYNAGAEIPYDSITVKGEIFIDSSKASFCSVNFPESSSTVTCDSNGRFEIAVSGEKKLEIVVFKSLFAETLELKLNSQFNHHELRIFLASTKYRNTNTIEPSIEKYKYLKTMEGVLCFTRGFNLTKIYEGKAKIRHLILQNKKFNPLSISLFNWIETLVGFK